MIRRCLLVALVLLLVPVGCGGDSDVPDALGETVASIRQSAEAGDVDEAQQQLDKLRDEVAFALDAGDLDRERAAVIIAAADDVEQALGGQAETTTTTISTTTTTTTTTSPPRDKRERDDDEGKGKGRGKKDD